VYYSQADGADSEHLNSPFRTKAATWNASAGAEYYFSNNWALRGGVFTNNANTPSISRGSNQPEHVDMFGVSASLSRFTRNSSLTVGFAHSSGEGDAQIVSGVNSVQTLAIATTTFFLSSSYNY
jgi:long-chain fatty acid transport protein